LLRQAVRSPEDLPLATASSVLNDPSRPGWGQKGAGAARDIESRGSGGEHDRVPAMPTGKLRSTSPGVITIRDGDSHHFIS
jgi:hypothetical protein